MSRTENWLYAMNQKGHVLILGMPNNTDAVLGSKYRESFIAHLALYQLIKFKIFGSTIIPDVSLLSH